MNRLFVFLATGFGLGSGWFSLFQRVKFSHLFLPSRWTGAGLAGSLFALFLVWLGIEFQGISGFAILALLTFLAIFIIDRAEKSMQAKDDPRIILDEIIGFFWATAFLPISRGDLPSLSLSFTKGEMDRGWILLTAFLLFRIFDIAKLPFPQTERLRGGFGVVVDDVGAGILANLILQLALCFIQWL